MIDRIQTVLPHQITVVTGKHVGRGDSFKMRSYGILYHLYLYKAGNTAVDRMVYTLVPESRT